MVSPILCGLLVPQSQLKKNILRAFCTKCESHTGWRGRTLAWGAARQGVTGVAGVLQEVAGLTGVLLLRDRFEYEHIYICKLGSNISHSAIFNCV